MHCFLSPSYSIIFKLLFAVKEKQPRTQVQLDTQGKKIHPAAQTLFAKSISTLKLYLWKHNEKITCTVETPQNGCNNTRQCLDIYEGATSASVCKIPPPLPGTSCFAPGSVWGWWNWMPHSSLRRQRGRTCGHLRSGGMAIFGNGALQELALLIAEGSLPCHIRTYIQPRFVAF